MVPCSGLYADIKDDQTNMAAYQQNVLAGNAMPNLISYKEMSYRKVFFRFSHIES